MRFSKKGTETKSHGLIGALQEALANESKRNVGIMVQTNMKRLSAALERFRDGRTREKAQLSINGRKLGDIKVGPLVLSGISAEQMKRL